MGFEVGSILEILDEDYWAFSDLQLNELRVAIFVDDFMHTILFR